MKKTTKKKITTKKTRKAISVGVYLDYAATTPLSEKAFRAMKPYFSSVFGNTESIHSFGQDAMAALDCARERVAAALNVHFREIIFTSGATEANNMALFGALTAIRDLPQSFVPNIIISSIEHASIFSSGEVLRRKGFEVRFVKPDKDGVISPESVKELLDEQTVFVSVMHGNNEIGTIEPIAEIAHMIRNFRGDKKFPLFHTDAVQTFQFLTLHPYEIGIDMMTLSSHKLYGPKGVGLLFVRSDTTLQPILFGGNQEFGFRPGTVNVPAVVGFAEAVQEAEKNRALRGKTTSALKKYFCEKLKKIDSAIKINGFEEYGKKFQKSLPHIINVYFPGFTAEHIIIALDMAGIAVSAGSACTARGTTSSRVIREITHDEARAGRSVRFSFGENTTKGELNRTLKELKKILIKKA